MVRYWRSVYSMTIRKMAGCILSARFNMLFDANAANPVSISGGRGTLQGFSLFATPLLLGVESAAAQPLSSDLIIVLTIIGIFLLIGIFVLIRILRDGSNG